MEEVLVCRLEASPLVTDILRAALVGEGCVRLLGPEDPDTPDVTVTEVDGVVQVRSAAGILGTVDVATGTPADVVALVVASRPPPTPPTPPTPNSRQ